MDIKSEQSHPEMATVKLVLRSQLNHCFMDPGSGSCRDEALPHSLEFLIIEFSSFDVFFLYLVVC